MDDMAFVKVKEAVEELICQGFEDGNRDGGSQGLGVVMDNLLGECMSRNSSTRGRDGARESHVLRTQRPCRSTCLRG